MEHHGESENLLEAALLEVVRRAVREVIREELALALGKSPARGGDSPPHAEELLTVAEVAGVLRLPPSTVYELIRRGKLPAVRAGRSLRVPRDALKRWIAGGGVPREEAAAGRQNDPFKSLREPRGR
jgi:excisionase family DNA binding protein